MEDTTQGTGTTEERVLAFIAASPVPVSTRDVRRALGLTERGAREAVLRLDAAGMICRPAGGSYRWVAA